MTFALILLTSVAILITILLQPSRVIYLKQMLVPAVCIIFVLCLILMSGTVLASAKNGLTLWAYVIFPSLFPFFVAAEILNATGFIRTSGLLLEPLMRPFFNVPGSASFALAMGISSGYPMGAKITSDLRSNGILTKAEAERLLAFTNNSGPIFVIGAIGTTMYGSTAIGLLLFTCHIAACITVGLLFRHNRRSARNVPSGKNVPSERNVTHVPAPTVSSARSVPSVRNVPPRSLLKKFGRELRNQASSNRPSLAVMLGDAVKSSLTSILVIGGFVVLFSVIIQVLTDIGIISFLSSLAANLLSPLGLSKEILEGLISGLFEITTGSGIICSAPSVALTLKLPVVSFIIGWAGLSVHSQVMSIISKTDIRIRPYLFGKFLQGIFASLYTWVGLKILHFEGTVLANAALQADSKIIHTKQPYLSNFFNLAGKSLSLLLAIALLFFIVFMLASFRKATGRRHSFSHKKKSSI